MYERITQTLPERAETLPVQDRIKDLSDQMLAHKPEGSSQTFMVFKIDADAEEVQQRLRQIPAGQILLEDGEELGIENSDDYYQPLNLKVGQADLFAVGMRAYGWEHPRLRYNDDDTLDQDLLNHKTDWQRQIDIELAYKDDETGSVAVQSLTIDTSQKEHAELPRVSRSVEAPAYAEMGYEGHNYQNYPVKNEAEVNELLDIMSELFAKRVAPPQR